MVVGLGAVWGLETFGMSSGYFCWGHYNAVVVYLGLQTGHCKILCWDFRNTSSRLDQPKSVCAHLKARCVQTCSECDSVQSVEVKLANTCRVYPSTG